MLFLVFCFIELRLVNWIFDIREYRYGKKISIEWAEKQQNKETKGPKKKENDDQGRCSGSVSGSGDRSSVWHPGAGWRT